MRVYIIGNDGITLCRTAPATVNNGEIGGGSNGEPAGAPVRAKGLAGVGDRLPGLEKGKKVGDRDWVAEQLGAGNEAFPAPGAETGPKAPSKQAVVIAMLRL